MEGTHSRILNADDEVQRVRRGEDTGERGQNWWREPLCRMGELGFMMAWH